MLIVCGRAATCILLLLLFCVVALLNPTAALNFDDECQILDQPGKCTKEADGCSVLEHLVLAQQLRNSQIPQCGISTYGEIVCCPTNATAFLESVAGPMYTERRIDKNLKLKMAEPTSTTASAPKPESFFDATSNVRPAVRACREYEEFARSIEWPATILNGIAAAFGEFPHMGAIGYRPGRGNDQSDKLEFNCGAVLIAARFVLTAAHCIASTDLHPEVVRFGFTDFTSSYQRHIEIPINQSRIFAPQNYSIGKTYDDIAVMELEDDVPFSRHCYPTCLYTEPETPEDLDVVVTGWGVTEKRKKSVELLKLLLRIQPISECNDAFRAQGQHRRFDRGIIASQLCAYDAGVIAEQQGDACTGDSGGPLVEVVEQRHRIYRVVGIVSSGFSCGTNTAGLYTRVSAYLDFIEKIVWPQT